MTHLSPSTGDRPVALYLRVSTEEQADRGTVEGQREFLERYVGLYHLEVADVYVDDPVSGTVPLSARPAGRRLVEDALHGRFGTVIVYRVDRLGRSLPTLLEAHATLEGAGVAIKSATEPFDTSEPVGRFIFQLLGTFAEFERSTINERMTLGRDRAARSGKWTNGPVPYGYDLDGDGCLVPSNRPAGPIGLSEADVARSVFERMAEGSTTVAEAARLNAVGARTTRIYSGGRETSAPKEWQASRVNQMLRNTLYRGLHVVRSTKSGPILRTVPALVDEPLWQRANERLVTNRSLPKANSIRRNLLQGLVICADCNRKFVGTPKSGKGGHRYYYRCGSQFASVSPSSRCDARLLPAEELEQRVWDDCRRWIRDPGRTLATVEQQIREQAEAQPRREQVRDGLARQAGEKQAERERVIGLHRRGLITLDEVERQLGTLARELAVVEAEQARAEAEAAVAEELVLRQQEATALLADLRDSLDQVDHSDDWETKRKLVELLVAGVSVRTVREGRSKRAEVEVTYRFGEAPQGGSGAAGAAIATTGRRGRIPGTG